MSVKKTNFEVHSFIIFDPSLTDNDNEEERKILYCHPKKFPIKEQTTTIGLCEAMCNFTREFTSSPCQYIHTMKTRIVLHKLEKGISMILTVKIPRISDIVDTKTAENANHKKVEHDGYMDDEIQNSICESIVSHCRQMFLIFMGPPSLIIQSAGINCLRDKLTAFFDKYIDQNMFDNYQITDGLTGVHYLAMDDNLCSKVEKLITDFQAQFSAVCCSMFLFNNNLIFSNMDKEDLGIVYRYLTTERLVKYTTTEAMNSSFTSTNMGRFILESLRSGANCRVSGNSQIFLGTMGYVRGDISSLKQCNVFVYKALQATMVFFVEESATIGDNFNSLIHEYLGPSVTSLAHDINRRNSQLTNNPTDISHRYLYWNPQTLSIKTTLVSNKQSKMADNALPVPTDTMRLMSDIRDELDREDRLMEMAVKLQSDSWVAGVKYDRRELLIAINKRNFSLVDVSKEMKHVCQRYFHDIIKLPFE